MSDTTLDEILRCLDSNPGLQSQVKLGLLKWRDEAKAEAQLEILMGFRRRDFADGNMYKVAVLDRVAKLRKEVE